MSDIKHRRWSIVKGVCASYPNITACQIITLLSRGDPCTPEGGSCWSLLKSLISLFLAAVDMIPLVLPMKWRQFCRTSRLVSFKNVPSPNNTSVLSGKSTDSSAKFVFKRKRLKESGNIAFTTIEHSRRYSEFHFVWWGMRNGMVN